MAAMEGKFQWTIDDLEVVTRDDIAVAWGINRTRVTKGGETIFENRSRGTFVFLRVDGQWKTIHQHFSFPYDPKSGNAITDLKE